MGTVLTLQLGLERIMKKGDKVMATAPISKYPGGRPKSKVIKTNKVSTKSLQRLLELGYTVIISHG